MQECVVGVDVSKHRLDVFDPRGGGGQVANEAVALESCAAGLARQRAFVVFEATGRYAWPLRDAPEAAGAAYHCANPAQARHFARACGVIGKTDRVDARLLASMGSTLALRPTAVLSGKRRRIKALGTRRRQLVDMKTQEKTRLHEVEPFLREGIGLHIAWLSREIARLDTQIARETRADPELAAQQKLLLSAPGVGPVVAAALAAELPELGQLDRRKIAALAGLAPIARDSGTRTPVRRIGGGRPYLRSMLYLAALQASRRCDRFIAFRERLQAKGKTPKQAIIAVARKLLTTLNAMLKTNTPFAPEAI